jgi:hypothetical protein
VDKVPNIKNKDPIIINASEAARILGRKTEDICRWIKKGKVPWGFVDEKDGAINKTYVIFKPAMLQWINHGNVEVTNNIHISEKDFSLLGRMIITR